MTPMTTLKALPGLGLGIAAINFSPHWRNNAPEMFIQFFGWLFVMMCGGIIAVTLLWQLTRWQISMRERSRAMRAMRSETGQRANPFQSQWFTNGIILFWIGGALYLSSLIVARHSQDWMIYGIIRFLSQMINWPILYSILVMGFSLMVVGTIFAVIPFLIRAKQSLDDLASRGTILGNILNDFLPWRNDSWFFLLIMLIVIGVSK